MAGPGNIIIRVGAETADAVRGLSAVNKSLGSTMTTTEKVSAGLKKAALPAAAALTAIGVGAKSAIDDASALNEQINKTATVFGPAGAAMEDWSKTLVQSFGISSEAALEAAGTFGNMLVPMGFARGDAAKMSETMVQLAGDMASFNNASPEQTLEALRAGLAGESEPLRKFGVFLSDARLKQEALQQGLYDGKGALDAHAKAAATFAIVMKDTADAQGDFARTSDSVANQQRIQAASMENLSAQLGQSLLPAMQMFQKLLISVTSFTSEHTGAVKVLVGVVATLSAGILLANAALKAYAAAQAIVKVATAAWTAAQWLLNAALTANPIGLVIAAVAALAAGLVIAYTKSETFRNIVNAAFAAVKSAVMSLAEGFRSLMAAASAAFEWIVAHWKLALFAFGPLGAAIYVLVENFDKVAAAATAAFGAVKSAIDGVLGAIHAVISAVESLIGALGRIHVPHIDLPGPLSLPTATTFGGAPSARGVSSSSSSSTRAPITVNVYGAVDAEGTARTILRVLNAHERRLGLAI